MNEPHPGGGAPVTSSNGSVMFNDILGTTLGVSSNDGYASSSMTTFGDTVNCQPSTTTFFTGKPHVDGLGHAFLLRNYRADLGKWPTADPLGYPDGWNQMAYGVNSPMEGFDYLGARWVYSNFTYSDEYNDLVVVPHSLPLDAPSVGPGFWSTFLAWMTGNGAEIVVDYAKQIAMPIWEQYKYFGRDSFWGDVHDATSSEAIEEMNQRGFSDWEFVRVEFFNSTFDASNHGESTFIRRITVIWQVQMRKWEE